ncbi:MAG TPA: RidA family protein [Gemmatimonadales bacterium]|nr:RidA family protein [Gemmatimonadales bacterium]
MISKLLQVSIRTCSTALVVIAVICGPAAAQGTGTRYINPKGLVKPTGYTHLVIAPDGRTVYIAGQVSLDSAGKVVGTGDFAAQAEQVFENLQHALGSVGGSMADLVKTTTFVTDVRHVAALRDIRGRFLSRSQPPANTLLVVSGLARPELLIEIEGVAMLGSIVRQ